MKKCMRIITLSLVLVMLCTSLSGCKALDSLKDQQAFFTVEKTILWNDTEYRQLPYSEYMRPTNEWEIIYTTESDVPVLLSPFFGSESYVCNDGRILLVSSDYGESLYYCCVEEYDSVVANIEKAAMGTLEYDSYRYMYDEYDENGYYVGGRERILTDDQMIMLEKALSEATVRTDGQLYAKTEYIAAFYVTSQDGLFYADEAMEISCYDPAGNGQNLWVISNYYEGIDYILPEKYTAEMDLLMAPAVASHEQYMGMMDEMWE